MEYIELAGGALRALINPRNQQLVSFTKNGIEYLHGGGKEQEDQQDADTRGWPNTEILMFPLVGPAQNNEIHTPQGVAPLGQHGFVRYMDFTLTHNTNTSATFVLHYNEHTPVENPKKNPSHLEWPYSVTIEKTYTLTSTGLEATFKIHNTSTHDMPYMFGWHPAFYIQDLAGIVRTDDQAFTLHEIRNAQPAVVAKAHKTEYKGSDRTVIVTSNCEYVMLWSPPDSFLLCIEPVSAPAVFKGSTHLPQTLPAKASATYSVHIRTG